MMMSGDVYKRYSDNKEFILESRLNGKKQQYRLVDKENGKCTGWYYHDNMIIILFDQYIRKGMMKYQVDAEKSNVI